VELPLERHPLVSGLTTDQIEILRRSLEPVAWPAGHVVFRNGDPGSSLYLVTQGRASVHLRHQDGDIRLVTFAAGAVFGELALLDRGPRSAPVTADEDLRGFGLSEALFSELCRSRSRSGDQAFDRARTGIERADPLRQLDDPAAGNLTVPESLTEKRAAFSGSR